MGATIGPRDFDPYRADIRDCYCKLCVQTSYYGRSTSQQITDARALLDALRAGEHVRVELAEYVAAAKAAHAVAVAEACAAGKSELYMLGMHRGYHGGNNAKHYYREPYGEDMMVGLGIGMTPGRHEAAVAALEQRRADFRARRAAELPALIETDRRNVCTYFRMSGEVCTHHTAMLAEVAELAELAATMDMQAWSEQALAAYRRLGRRPAEQQAA